MAEGYTKTINTNGEFVNLTTDLGITFTSGKSYTIQVQNVADIKIANAIFSLVNQEFTYWAGSVDVYIKTAPRRTCVLTVLENEEE